MSVAKAIFTKVGDLAKQSTNKITFVGIGSVGMACMLSAVTQSVTTDVALIDMAEDKLIGERMDLEHGTMYLNNTKVQASKDYAISAGSKICVISSGVRQKVGETRLDLVSRNVDVFKQIIPNLVKASPDAIIFVVANPCDILTYVAWKLSNLPKWRVIGSGTSLDTARFKYFISRKLGIRPSSVNGWVIGEHGDSSVPVWSGVNVGGVRLCELISEASEDEKWSEVHKDVVQSAYEIIRLKGYTNTAIGLCTSAVCNGIINNTGGVFPISTCVNGMHGVDRDVFLSYPCVVGGDGVSHITRQTLSCVEEELFLKSVDVMSKIIDDLKL